MRPINEERMQRTLGYITKYQIAEGVSPTYRQIMDDLHYNTINTVAKDIQRLKERGLLESDNSTGFNWIGSLFRQGVSDSHNSLIVGTVHCGQPSPALEDIETAVSLPKSATRKVRKATTSSRTCSVNGAAPTITARWRLSATILRTTCP